MSSSIPGWFDASSMISFPPKVVYSIVEGERAGLQRVVDTMCGWGLDRVAKHGGQILNTTVPEIS